MWVKAVFLCGILYLSLIRSAKSINYRCRVFKLEDPVSKKFVTVDDTDGFITIDDSVELKRQRFKVEFVGENFRPSVLVHLKSHYDKYLSVQPDGKLKWNKSEAKTNETFRAFHDTNGRIRLQTKDGDRYIKVEQGSLIATKQKSDSLFNLEVFPNYCSEPVIKCSKIGLSKVGTKRLQLVRVDPNGLTIAASANEYRRNEQITVNYVAPNYITLKSHHNKYLSAENNRLVWNKSTAGNRERFIVFKTNDGRIVLQTKDKKIIRDDVFKQRKGGKLYQKLYANDEYNSNLRVYPKSCF